MDNRIRDFLTSCRGSLPISDHSVTLRAQPEQVPQEPQEQVPQASQAQALQEPAAQEPAAEEEPFPMDFKLNLDELKFGRNYTGE